MHPENDIFTNRMPKERLEKALEQKKTLSEEDYAKVVGLANIVRPVRSFLFNRALPMCCAGFPGHFGEPFSSFEENMK